MYCIRLKQLLLYPRHTSTIWDVNMEQNKNKTSSLSKSNEINIKQPSTDQSLLELLAIPRNQFLNVEIDIHKYFLLPNTNNTYSIGEPECNAKAMHYNGMLDAAETKIAELMALNPEKLQRVLKLKKKTTDQKIWDLRCSCDTNLGAATHSI